MSNNKVFGKKGTPLSASQLCASAQNFDLFCHPCDEDHKHIEACGFCVECKDYLCGNCVQFHKKFRSTRNHVILDKHSMPKDVRHIQPVLQAHLPKDTCTEPCTKHHGKILEYYCESHKEFGCNVCVTLGHITCGVGYIPELSKGIVKSKEYGALLKQIDSLQKKIEKTKGYTLKSIAEVEQESETYTNKVTKLGEDTIKHIRDLMQAALDEKDKFVQKLLVDLQNSSDQSGKMIEEISAMQLELKSKNNSDIESLVLMKLLPPNIKAIKDALNKMQIDSKPTVFQFKENTNLQCVKETKTFGSLITYKKIVEQLEDINICTESNRMPRIVGVEVLSDGKLAIVDENNTSIQLVDTKHNHLTETKLQDYPWGITEVSEGQLAVTLPQANKIQFLSITDKKVMAEHLIEVDGNCWGIAAHQSKLIVGVVGKLANEVQILELSGRVLRRITTGDDGENLFRLPPYIAVNPSNNLIYVSDYYKNTLICVTLEGEVKFVYIDEDMDDPSGLAIDTDGSVFVCGSCCIQHVTGDGRKIQTLLGPGQEGASSRCIAYDGNTGNIVVRSSWSLHIYHLE